MALLASELQRIKAELGYNVLAVGAEPYVGVTQLFEQVVQPHTLSGATTTCTTAVTAATAPTARTLTLADATDFAAGARVIVDVDDRQEVATVESIAGSTITVLLSLAHATSYPVTVEGGESIIRELLGNCIAEGKRLRDAGARAGIAEVDEVKFFAAGADGTDAATRALSKRREMWRRELAEAIGVPYLRGQRQRNGSSLVAF